MKPTKLCLTSQISLYRSRNLRKLNGAAATEVSANNVAEVICQTLARAVDVARITVKSVATCADSVAGRSEEEATGRNTTPDEVNASKFDLDNALRAFAKLKDADTCFQSTQRATYATVASNRNGNLH
ncbi:aarF domain-containing kinase 4, putative [Babesia caballi]|uniref:AarF domain-containing kinase 4, putative n=1 Tax=Babesia caballi TaxID=5871 RepID=A0AAV4M1L8_BABCB|nr:aarF domain-containing kinase 4, putative [Babesia caballi]